MSAILHWAKSFFVDSSFEWLDTSLIGDWAIATFLYILSKLVDRLPVFEREFDVSDPLIKHHHTKQQISGFTTNLLCFVLPLCILIIVSCVKRSAFELHHSALGLWTSSSLSRLVTEALKNRVGRLRPDFLARCKWGKAIKQCTGKIADIVDGRKSFPSGHSSTAFVGMTFMFLWLSAKTAAWCFAAPLPPRSPWVLASRLGRVLLTLLPLTFATWVAVSRVEDYRHHKEDVIVGSLIGIICGAIGYFSFWPNPFSHDNHKRGIAHQPRLLYRNETEEGLRNRGYELADLEEGRDRV